MDNVISLARHRPARSGVAKFAALTTGFAAYRRHPDDVYWLKENAELLNILEATNAKIPEAALAPYQEFYSSLPERLRFFPQYYRFFVGMALDLEALGLSGETAEALCHYCLTEGLADAELSDLQRGEMQRHLARRNLALGDADELRERMVHFANSFQSFTVPNRKAAYELTHVVFYLSEYGTRDPQIGEGARKSLMFTGILALLEQNIDLLAEVAISLRYGGFEVPPEWDAEIAQAIETASIMPGISGDTDDYHAYLMGNWSLATAGRSNFNHTYDGAGNSFACGQMSIGVLHELSFLLYNFDGRRRRDWEVMKQKLLPSMSQEQCSLIDRIVGSTSDFDEFFSYFARAGTPKGRIA